MFHGADPTGAQAVAQRLLRTSSAMQGLADRVMAAEAMAELSTHAVAMIDDASLVLRSTASAIETAAHQVGNFELPLAIAWRPMEPARDRLPVEDLLEVEADLFGQLTRAIELRQTPAEAGLHSDYFPPGYLDWLAADHAVVEATTRLADYRRIAGDQPALFDGATEYALARHLHDVTAIRAELALQQAIEAHAASGVSRDVAIAAALAGSFESGAQLLGGYLAGREPTVDEAGFLTLLVSDVDIAAGFFNELGAEGTVDLAHRWAGGDADQWGEARPVLSQALASVTQADRLGFSGRAFVAADHSLVPSQRTRATNSFHVEQLLVDGDFDTGFVVSAAQQSFERHAVGTYPGAASSGLQMDRRITAMAAVLRHDATPAFVAQLSDAELETVITAGSTPHRVGGTKELAYGVEHADLGGQDLVTSLFFNSVLVDRATTDRVIEVVAGLERPIADERVADGLSLALAGAALDYFDTDREPAFLHAYENIVASGSGLSLAVATDGDMVETFLRNELADGWIDNDSPRLEALGTFRGEIKARYLAGDLTRADNFLADRAELDRLMMLVNGAGTALSAIGTVGSIAAPLAIGGVALGASTFAVIGAVALAIGGVLLAVGVFGKDPADPRVPVLRDVGVELLHIDDELEATALRALDGHPLQSKAQLDELEDWAVLIEDRIIDGSDGPVGRVLCDVRPEEPSRVCSAVAEPVPGD